MSKRIGLRLLILAALVFALALLGGAGRTAASSTQYCNSPLPTGRLFCLTVEDQDGVSPSGLVGTPPRQENVLAYQFYKFTITNVGGNTLTNGTLQAVLTDNVTGSTGPVNSTALFVPSGSFSGCSLVSQSPNTVNCLLPNMAAGSNPLTVVVAYRTSTTANVASTDAHWTVGFKEGSNPNGANPSSLSNVENTSLEPDPESSVSWSPPGQDVLLGTSPNVDSQFTTLDYHVPPGHAPFVATEGEGAGTLCSAGLTCFGEVVTTNLNGADDGTFFFHLRITMDLALLPGGNINNLAVVHHPDSGTDETIRTRCTSVPPATPAPLPCIKVTKDNQAKLLIIDVYASHNGGWHPGI